MKDWIKKQLKQRLWTVIAAVLCLCYLLSWAIFWLCFTDNLNKDPLIYQAFVGSAIFMLLGGPLPIFLSSIVGICSKDKIGKIWCAAFLLLDLFPMYMCFPTWRSWIGY